MSSENEPSAETASRGEVRRETITTGTKEKRGWFHSLTRRKKSSDTTLSDSATSAHLQASSVGSFQNANNNNEPSEATTSNRTNVECVPIPYMPTSSAVDSGGDCSSGGGALGKQRKDKKNIFQRIRKKMELRLSSIRHWRSANNDDDDGGLGSGTTDATCEFVTHACIEYSLPFTYGFDVFIVKKWLEREEGPNFVMYKACSEMIEQVWYWGEISRRDAQKQLTDKPTGSFLVRDSETSDSQFTLSFRIVNVTLHYRLEYRDGYWHFEELKYDSIVEMIKDILHRCTNDNFVCFVKVPNEMQPPFPVILKYPLSRYLNMPKLQDLCRRVIQQQVSDVDIARLPVPVQMLEYLSVRKELDFQS